MLSSASELFPESLVVVCQYRKSCNGSVSSCVSKPHKTNRACASYVRSALGKKPVWEHACFRETGIIITTCINVYLFLQTTEEKRRSCDSRLNAKTLAPTNVLSVLTEVGWATGCTLRVRESRTSQPRIRRNDLFVPVELVSCRWQQSQGGYKRSWRRFGSHETRTPTLNGLQCPNIKQATTKAEQCKKISHRGR